MKKRSFATYVACGLVAGGLAQPACADPITYTLDATATFSDGTVTLAGKFTYFDFLISAVDITAAGPTDLIPGGSDALTDGTTGAPGVIMVSDPFHTVDLTITFASVPDLTPDSIAGISGLLGGSPSIETATSVTGEAAPVPEPASLPLFGGGLIVLGLVRRLKRKAA